MNAQAQIRKYKGHVELFANELRRLIESFKLLVPIAENAELLKQFRGNKKSRCVLILRDDLIRCCVLGITKLTYDQQKNNPTAGNLIGALLDPKHGHVRSLLKDDFSVPIKLSPAPTEAWEIEIWKREDEKEARKLRAAFDRYLRKLQERRDWFDSKKTEFLDLRDKVIAHLDPILVGDKYELRKLTGPTWGVMKQAVKGLIDVAEILLVILHRKGGGFGHDLKLARENARAFWSLRFKV